MSLTNSECCLELDGQVSTIGSGDDANTCVGAVIDGIPSDISLDDACYYYNQQTASQGGPSLESVGGFLEGLGSFVNNIFGIFGANPAPDATTGGGQGQNPSRPSQQQDKARRNTLLILGLIAIVVIGFAAYTITKKKR